MLSGWNILFFAFALTAAFLGLLLPEFPSALRDATGRPSPEAAAIGPTLGLLFLPMLFRLTRHVRPPTALEYTLLGLALAPFGIGLFFGDALSLKASLATGGGPLVVLLFALVALIAVAVRLGSEDACRLPARRPPRHGKRDP